jgi:prolipoprotein diacylglyceryltransferase
VARHFFQLYFVFINLVVIYCSMCVKKTITMTTVVQSWTLYFFNKGACIMYCIFTRFHSLVRGHSAALFAKGKLSRNFQPSFFLVNLSHRTLIHGQKTFRIWLRKRKYKRKTLEKNSASVVSLDYESGSYRISRRIRIHIRTGFSPWITVLACPST